MPGIPTIFQDYESEDGDKLGTEPITPFAMHLAGNSKAYLEKCLAQVRRRALFLESDKYVCHAGVGPLFDYESQRWFAVGGVMTRG